jgi:hypothetical protein
MVLKILHMSFCTQFASIGVFAYKLDHLNFPLPFFSLFFAFFFLSCKARMAKVIHLLFYYVMSIIIFNVSISCKHILDSYNF